MFWDLRKLGVFCTLSHLERPFHIWISREFLCLCIHLVRGLLKSRILTRSTNEGWLRPRQPLQTFTALHRIQLLCELLISRSVKRRRLLQNWRLLHSVIESLRCVRISDRHMVEQRSARLARSVKHQWQWYTTTYMWSRTRSYTSTKTRPLLVEKQTAAIMSLPKLRQVASAAFPRFYQI